MTAAAFCLPVLAQPASADPAEASALPPTIQAQLAALPAANLISISLTSPPERLTAETALDISPQWTDLPEQTATDPSAHPEAEHASTWRVPGRLQLKATYRTRDDRPLLGEADARPAAFGSRKADIGALEVRSPDRGRIFAAASLHIARNRQHLASQNWLTPEHGGALSGALHANFGARSIVHASDMLSFTLHQPVHNERGASVVSANDAIDQHLAVSSASPLSAAAERKLALEAVYARALMDDKAELSAFIRGEANTAAGTGADTTQMLGAAFKLAF